MLLYFLTSNAVITQTFISLLDEYIEKNSFSVKLQSMLH
jgi:hypothetical protein